MKNTKYKLISIGQGDKVHLAEVRILNFNNETGGTTPEEVAIKICGCGRQVKSNERNIYSFTSLEEHRNSVTSVLSFYKKTLCKKSKIKAIELNLISKEK